MKKGVLRKQQILERLADHVLLEGLQSTSLRPLAAAAGTSDRMLLHYFVDKEELLTAILTVVMQRLIVILDQARAEPMPFQRLLPQLSAMLKDERIRPYMRLWLDLAAAAAGEKEPFRSIARHISSTLLSWIAVALIVPTEAERAPLAALTLSIIEGFVILDALGDDTTPRHALAGVALKASAWGGTDPLHQ
jgi:AcrR family transcriptional regulator